MVNKIILLGHLGKDPETRNFEGGNSVTTFSLATTENYKDRDGNRQKRTEWHNIVIWNKLGEIAATYLKKGALVYLEGRLSSRSYQTEEGTTRYVTDIVVSNMQMMPKTMVNNTSHTEFQNNSNNANPKDNFKATTSNAQSQDKVEPQQEENDLPF